MTETINYFPVKAKLARNKRAREQTGGGASEEEPLSAIEQLYAKTVFTRSLAYLSTLPSKYKYYAS